MSLFRANAKLANNPIKNSPIKTTKHNQQKADLGSLFVAFFGEGLLFFLCIRFGIMLGFTNQGILAMHLTLSHELLLKATDFVAKAASKHHRFVILGNIKFVLSDDLLTMTASDLEVEITTTIQLPAGACIEGGQTTINAATFHEIIRSLPDGDVSIQSIDNARCIIKSGKSKFTLATLPAEDYPSIGTPNITDKLIIKRQDLLDMISHTRFSVATQDVRYYLTGMLFHVNGQSLTAVATDGHRLAVSQQLLQSTHNDTQIVVPGKAVVELERLFGELGKSAGQDDTVSLGMENEFLQVSLNFGKKREDGTMDDELVVSVLARLIDGKFPDYRRVIPTGNDKFAIVHKDELMSVLRRVSIVSDEKYRGVVFEFDDNQTVTVRSYSGSTDRADEAVESLAVVSFEGSPIEISLNETYLKAVLAVLTGDVKIAFKDSNSPILITQVGDELHQYVIMPMRI